MRAKKKAEEDGTAGAPEWMVTFSDCMTLLLTFFVLLLSFSSFDERIFRQLKAIFTEGLPVVAPNNKTDRDSFLPLMHIQPTAELDEGSEKPTLDKGTQDSTKEDTQPVDFHSRKVFLIESKRIFWGKGAAISSEGRNIMSLMASFLKEMSSRIVISENGPEVDDSDERLGLARALAVLRYFATEQNLDKERFSISATSTFARSSLTKPREMGADQANPKSSEPVNAGQEHERMLEIVLLERSIYN
jgi:chemotaxis protein MotB